MRKFNSEELIPLFLLLAIVALCAMTPAHAEGLLEIKQITGYSIEYFPSPAIGGGFWATQDNGQLYLIHSDGTKQYWGGTIMDSPVSYKNGIAFYTRAQMEPSVWNWDSGLYEYPIQSRDWPSRPWITPSVSQNGRVAFASGNNHIAVYNGTTTIEWDQWSPSLWQLASMAWSPDGQLYATVQDRYDANLNGYHLFKLDPETKSAIDLGMGYSQVAGTGTNFLFNSWNHQTLTYSKWTNGGFQFQQNPMFYGVNYWNLGGALNGRFALLDGNYRLYEATVPEPGSLLAFGAGLIGLGGFIRRRRS